MADAEVELLCKTISTGQIEDVISRGIRTDLFADDDCKKVFSYLIDHARRFKNAPSIKAVQDFCEDNRIDFSFHVPSDSLDYLSERFVGLCKRRLAGDMVVELAQMVDDPRHSQEIDLRFLEVSRKLATLVPSTQVARFTEMEQRVEQYKRDKKQGRPTGIPWGFPTLDELTGGIQPHEFVTVAGFSGTGKSTMLMASAFNMWAKGHTPLYISLEMEAGAILRKFDAMAAGLDYSRLKHMGLDPGQMKNWEDKAQEIKESVADIPIIDSIRNCSPDHVFAEAVRYKPDIVVIDYLSLMRSGRPTKNSSVWQSLTEITQDLKQNARTLKIPILAAAQTNRSGSREGAELDNVGGSISVAQDSDIVIGLHSDEEMRERREMQIRLRKNRDGPLKVFDATWDHERSKYEEKDKWSRTENP